MLASKSTIQRLTLLRRQLLPIAEKMIRDNLTLNIIMLVWPLDTIRQWQMGG